MKEQQTRENSLSIILILSLIPWGFFFFYFKNQNISGESTDWADFGSYIGGTVTALTVPITFALLLRTYKSQKEVERISKLTFRNQRFEKRLFELIKVFNEYRFNQLSVYTRVGDKEKEYYNGLRFFLLKRRLVQERQTELGFDNAISNAIESANLSFEFYFRSLENIIITLDEINEENPEEKDKLFLMLVNTLTNDEKFFIKYFHYYQQFAHLNYLKKFQKQLAENLLYDYKGE